MTRPANLQIAISKSSSTHSLQCACINSRWPFLTWSRTKIFSKWRFWINKKKNHLLFCRKNELGPAVSLVHITSVPMKKSAEFLAGVDFRCWKFTEKGIHRKRYLKKVQSRLSLPTKTSMTETSTALWSKKFVTRINPAETCPNSKPG